MNRSTLVAHAKTSIDKGSKSFALASRLFDRETRERVWLLYAWCRYCDDMVDGQDHGGTLRKVDDVKARLAKMRQLTTQAFQGKPTGIPAFDALGIVAQECGLSEEIAQHVLDGFALDAEGWRPQTRDDLFQYCYHVAGAVGIMMAIIMGVSPENHDVLDRACDLGLGFQLANIARDVAEDARAGRVYIPQKWLDKHDIDFQDILSDNHSNPLINIINKLCNEAQSYEDSARIGARALPLRSRWAVLTAAGIYGDIARQVKASKGASLHQRISTSKGEKAFWLIKAGAQLFAKTSTGSNAARERQNLWNRPR